MANTAIRLSVTELDSFRYWKDREEASLADLLAQLRKEQPPTPAMLAGSAFHKALEVMAVAHVPDAEVIERDGFTFRIAADIEIDLPAITELKGETVIPTPSGLVTLVGVVDGIDGGGIRDYKTSQRFDAERYTDALQWRAYLHMFQADAFTYHVFECSDPARSSEVTISDYHKLTFYRYPGLGRDVELAVCELAAFIREYVPERCVVEGVPA